MSTGGDLDGDGYSDLAVARLGGTDAFGGPLPAEIRICLGAATGLHTVIRVISPNSGS